MATLPWVTVDDLDDPTSPNAQDAAYAASAVLYSLSGRRFSGARTVTETYEPRTRRAPLCYLIAEGEPFYRYSFSFDSGATYPYELFLRGTPVVTVQSVRYGAELRTIPANEWQLCNASILRPTPAATWSPRGVVTVTYSYGAAPPALGRLAARKLANELVKAIDGDSSCLIPERVTSVSREGVSMTVLDPNDFLDHGRTGIYEVDLFLKSINPAGATAPPRLWSSHMPRARRVTPQSPGPTVGRYDLSIIPGVSFDRRFSWVIGGVPQPLTGVWQVDSAMLTSQGGSQVIDLTPYYTLEPGGATGTIALDIPANVTSQMQAGGWWYLNVVRADDPTTVMRLLEGDVLPHL